MSITLDRILRCEKLEAENKALEESRDKLVENIRLVWEHIDGSSSGNFINDFYIGVLEGILQKAEALKEKETK